MNNSAAINCIAVSSVPMKGPSRRISRFWRSDATVRIWALEANSVFSAADYHNKTKVLPLSVALHPLAMTAAPTFWR